MSRIASSLYEPGVNPHAPSPEEINRQLRAILASPVFHGSRRCQQFLEYVCEKSLAGAGGSIKERMIAIDVFGRSPQTDLGEDTIVRVGAREVRKRLAQYYVTPEGAAAEVRIELPSGSYAPDFRYVTAAPDEIVAQPLPAPAANWWHSTQARLCGLAVLAAVAVLAVARMYAPSPNGEQFRRFWEPVFKSDEPLLVAVAHPIVYHPSSRAIRLSEANLPPQDLPTQRAIDVPPEKLTGADFVPVFNQYVGFGDMVAANEVAAMLARKSKTVRVRMASNIGFADLRKAQALLIGAITNRWTVELQQTWRFRFSWSPETRTSIVDTQDPAAVKTPGGAIVRRWSIQSNDDGSTPEDYVLVGRIHSSYTGGFVLEAAGLKQFGTEAAGRFLADPEQLGAILRKLPPGWENKNVQLVLHVRVIGNTPAQPEMVASHVW
jgi:hypothetical protein